MAFEGSARPRVALFDRAKQRRVNTTKQTPCPREVRIRPNSTRDVRHDVARRERTRRGGSGVAGVRRASDCVRARGPSPATAKGRPMAALESWVIGVCSVSMPRTPQAILDVTGPFSRVAARADARLRCARTRGFQKRRLDRAPGYRRRVYIPAATTTPRREAGRASRRHPPGGAPRASMRASRPPRRPHRSRGFLGFFPQERRSFSGRTRFFPVPRALEARSHPRRPTSSPSSHAQQVVAPTPAPSTRCPSRAPWAR